MRLRVIIIVLVFFLLSFQSAFAQSLASAMGDNISVLPSGAADAARNPALLLGEILPGEVSVYAGYLLYDEQNLDVDAEIKMPPLYVERGPFETYDPRKSLIEGGAAYYRKFGKAAFGMAVYGKSKKEKSSYDLHLSVSAVSKEIVFRNEGLNYESNTTGYAAFAYQINNWVSFGIQYKFEYKYEYEETENERYTNSTLSSLEYESTARKSYISSIVAGLIIKKNAFQIGFLLLSPELSIKTNNYENEKNDYDNPANSFSISDSTSRQLIRTSSLGFIIGMGYTVTGDFSVAGEGGFRMSGSFSERILVIENKNYEETDSDVDYKAMMIFSLGLRYRIDNSLSLACGGFGRYFSMKNEYHVISSSSIAEIDISQFGIRFGIEKRITPFYSIVFVGSAERMNIKSDVVKTQGNMTMNFSNTEKEHYFTASVAVRMFF